MQRMNGIDPMFIYSETPASPMEVAYTCVFDPSTAPGGYSFDHVRAVLEERLPTLVPFRRRLMEVPLGLAHPRWADDPEFDLDNHLHRAALPSPGGEAELSALAAEVMGRPLHPDQPPWEMHVIEGLHGGNVGLIAKLHHSVIDGLSGAQLMAQLLDLTAEEPARANVRSPWRPPALPSGARLVAEAVPHLLASPLRALRAAREIGRTSLRLAFHAADGGPEAVSIPLGAPAHFDVPVTARRTVSFAQANLGEVVALKDRLGVTLNDVVLAACSGAMRTYLSDHDRENTNPLVAVVPVSVRAESEQGALGNRLSAMFVSLASDRERPLDRLQMVVAACDSAKVQERSVGYGAMASAVAEAVPPAVAGPALRLGAQLGAVRRLRPGNLVISNVPGPKIPLFFAGMRMESVYPLGPVVDGVALNITVQSYRDALFIGLNACPAVVPDVEALARSVVTELGQLTKAAGEAGPGPLPWEAHDHKAVASAPRVTRSVPLHAAKTPHAALNSGRGPRPSRRQGQRLTS
jgi:diacylglycerol O-acyltransferase / wax synthase